MQREKTRKQWDTVEKEGLNLGKQRLQLRRTTWGMANGTVASSGNRVIQLVINPSNNVLEISKTIIFVPSEFIFIVVRTNKVQEYLTLKGGILFF